jgi:hypothetical protein
LAGRGVRDALPAFFARAAEACQGSVAAHLAAADPPDLHFKRHLLFALATLGACGERTDPTDDDLDLLRLVCNEAAGVCRTQPPEDSLVAVAACLDEVVHACDDALDDPPNTSRWQRFLFRDADVDVIRLHRGWRVRAGSGEARDKLLDSGLGTLLPLSSLRIAELTVQILAWYAYEAAFPD